MREQSWIGAWREVSQRAVSARARAVATSVAAIIVAVLCGIGAFGALVSNVHACTLMGKESSFGAWSVPYNLFSGSSELLVDATCAASTFTPRFGSPLLSDTAFLVYDRGFYQRDGVWEEYSISPASGGRREGRWIIGAGVGSPIEYQGINTFFAAYTCQWTSGGWRCGCQSTACSDSRWQVQAVAAPYADPQASFDPSNVSADRIPDFFLPFSQPALETLQQSEKKVYAHWFIWAISRFNGDPPSDNYAGALNTGARVFDARLMSRPIARPPRESSGSEKSWKILDYEDEMLLARALGVDGFLVNLPVPRSDPTYFTYRQAAWFLELAEDLDNGFGIGLNIDTGDFDQGTPLQSASTTAAQLLAGLQNYGVDLASDGWLRSEDGRVVAGSFAAGAVSGSWWSTLKSELSANGLDIYLICLNNGIGPPLPVVEYDPACDAWTDWGVRGASEAVRDYDTDFSGVPADEPIMASVNRQDQRYRATTTDSGLGTETQGSRTLRRSWMSAIESDTEFAQLVTWNDYGEHSAHMPTTASQFAAYDLNAYYITWFKTGIQPPIIRDNLYYFHRVYKGPPWHDNWVPGTDPYVNEIEVVGFLTAPGTIEIETADGVTSASVDAGIQSVRAPLPDSGKPVFRLRRDGETVLTVESAFTIGDPPGGEHSDIELVYRSGSALRALRSTPSTAGATCFERDDPSDCLSPGLAEPVWLAQ